MKKLTVLSILLIIGLACNTETMRQMDDVSDKAEIRHLITINSIKFRGTNPLILNISFKNQSNKAVKDLGVVCDLYGASGTKITRVHKSVYETINRGDTRDVPDLNFGSQDPQITECKCGILDFQIQH